MAKNETNMPEVAEAPVEERVEIYVPKGYAGEEETLLISVNGTNYVLPRGKKSLVPAHVAAEYERSLRAQEALDNRIDKMTEASK